MATAPTQPRFHRGRASPGNLVFLTARQKPQFYTSAGLNGGSLLASEPLGQKQSAVTQGHRAETPAAASYQPSCIVHTPIAASWD
jgi:hypothetical protein